jgi:hypothetical protein
MLQADRILELVEDVRDTCGSVLAAGGEPAGASRAMAYGPPGDRGAGGHRRAVEREAFDRSVPPVAAFHR